MGNVKLTPLLIKPQTVLHKRCLVYIHTEHNSNIIKVKKHYTTIIEYSFINLLN